MLKPATICRRSKLLQAAALWNQQGRFVSAAAYLTTTTQLQAISTALAQGDVSGALAKISSLSTLVRWPRDPPGAVGGSLTWGPC